MKTNLSAEQKVEQRNAMNDTNFMKRFAAGYRNRKVAAGVLCLLLWFAVCFCTVLPAWEANHDCTGEDCPVCECIAVCEQLARKLSAALTACAAAVIAVAAAGETVRMAGSLFSTSTLITLKVRLDN